MVRASFAGALGCGFAALAAFPGTGWAGSARDYLNAPIDTWLTFYNFGYSTLVTPEDGMDVTSSVTSNVVSQSIVVTRTMDYWGRTGGISVIFPYRYLNASSDAFRASNRGISDIAFLWQMNIFGGPALTKEQFRSFVPQTFSSFHLFVGTPLGKYNPANPLKRALRRTAAACQWLCRRSGRAGVALGAVGGAGTRCQRLGTQRRHQPRRAVGRAGTADGGVRSSRTGLGWFTEGFDTADLKESKALLDELT